VGAHRTPFKSAGEPGLRPKVSVVIPTYNRAQRVIHAIESVLVQTYRVDDIIVVDDGSTDDTRRMLDRAREAKPCMGQVVRYFRQANQGPSVARNKGLEEAKGDWIAFLDSDDLWLSEKVAYQLRALQAFEHSAEACFTDIQFTGSSDIRSTVFELRGERDKRLTGLVPDSVRLMLDRTRTPIVFVQTLVTKTNLARAVGGFDPELRWSEDADFLFRLACKTSFCFVNKPLVVVDRSPAQHRHIGPSAIWDRVEFRLAQSQYRCEKQLRSIGRMPRYVKTAILKDLRGVQSGWANWYLQNGNVKRSRESAVLAMKCRFSISILVKYFLLLISPALTLRLLCLRCRFRQSSRPAHDWFAFLSRETRSTK